MLELATQRSAESRQARDGESYSARQKFFCPEETSRYAGFLEQIVFRKLYEGTKTPRVIEFGSGTGEPVISAILNSGYCGPVEGYEINSAAVAIAKKVINEFGLYRQYKIYTQSFWDDPSVSLADYLIANPPYLPIEDKESLLLPELCGGKDGIGVSKDLLSLGCPNVMLLVSSYSNPLDLLGHAAQLGYRIEDFQITRMSFGVYSRQQVVQDQIRKMQTEGKAFFSERGYLVGGALFTKRSDGPDLLSDFAQSITALKNCNS